MFIKSCSFSLMPLHNQAQQLSVEFYEEAQQSPVSSKQFHFLQEDPFIEKGEILDVFSQNGNCKTPVLSQLFKSRDVQDAKKILKVADLEQTQEKTIFVLDLKDEQNKYLDASIAACEQEVSDFFIKKCPSEISKHAKNMHALFHDKLDFILNEGSLKKELLRRFFR